MTAMVVGAAGRMADRATSAFEAMRIIVIRVADANGACEQLAVDMPQVVLVLHALRPEERDALADRAAAVGALVLHVDPELDDETFGELVERTVREAIERKLRRDAAEARGQGLSEPPNAEDVD